jgi:hypothetical protein
MKAGKDSRGTKQEQKELLGTQDDMDQQYCF